MILCRIALNSATLREENITHTKSTKQYYINQNDTQQNTAHQNDTQLDGIHQNDIWQKYTQLTTCIKQYINNETQLCPMSLG
jgi:hypothetical protein